MFRCLRLCGVLALLAGLPVTMATNSLGQCSSPTSGALSEEQKKWLSLLESWIDSIDERQSAASTARNRVSRAVAALLQDDAIDGFCEDATSLRSHTLRARDDKGWRLWIRSRFVESVCLIDEIERTANVELARLEGELDLIDSQFLVAHDCDVEVDAVHSLRVLPKSKFRFDLISKRIDEAIGRVIPEIERANRTSVMKFGVETATGIAAERAVRLSSQDKEGNVSWGTAAVGLGVGLLADTVSQRVLDGQDQTLLNLNEAIARELVRLRREIADLLVAPETLLEVESIPLSSGGRVAMVTTIAEGEFTLSVSRHIVALHSSLSTSLALNSKWMNEVAAAAHLKRHADD